MSVSVVVVMFDNQLNSIFALRRQTHFSMFACCLLAGSSTIWQNNGAERDQRARV